MKHSKRIYLFDLPHSIVASYIQLGLPRFKKNGMFQRLPPYLQKKLQKAADNWWGLRVHRKDLDAIDDRTWTELANALGLKWKFDKRKTPPPPEPPKDKKASNLLKRTIEELQKIRDKNV